MSRPDIASQLRFKKEETLVEARDQLINGSANDSKVKILTNCPACQQGLSRFADDTGMDTDYIVVEMMKHLHGEKWQNTFVERITNRGIEKVLL